VISQPGLPTDSVRRTNGPRKEEQVQNGRQIDLSTQVERVKRRTRPWKSIIALLLAIAAAVLSHQARHDSRPIFSATNRTTDHLIAALLAVAFLTLGSVATYSLAGKARELLQPKAGTAHAAVAGYAILIVGAFTTLVVTLELFGVPIGQLVLGGALTSVFVGIAAQQALGNVFAGLVLLFARPFQVGDAIRLRAGALGGTLDGIVTDIGITYVRFDTDGSVMSIPNSQVLNAVVGPIPPEEEADEVITDGKSGTPGGPEQPQPHPAGPV
jgi:small-conductance mechanosensitive channel